MQRHAYGSGEYKYFRYPLPDLIARLRVGIYPRLAPIANAWHQQLREAGDFPPALEEYLAECHKAGQERPTPLMLKYGAGDYNRLHQDLYGPLVFPLQLTVLLSNPEPGLFRRRVPVGRAAAAHAVAWRGRSSAAGRGGDFPGPSPPGRGRSGFTSCHDAARRQPHSRRRAIYPRHHLSRRRLSAENSRQATRPSPAVTPDRRRRRTEAMKAGQADGIGRLATSFGCAWFRVAARDAPE